MAIKQPVSDKFDIFEDRVTSLLARWRQFKDKSAKQQALGSSINISDEAIIKACLNEINDGFTQHLTEPDNVTVDDMFIKDCVYHGSQAHVGPSREDSTCIKCNKQR